MYLIWLSFFGGGFGGFGRGTAETANLITANDQLLLSTIQNGQNCTQRDIERVASALQIDSAQAQEGLCKINTALATIGGQMGMNAQQIINAIISGDAATNAKIAECCCENRLSICQQTNALQAQAAANAFNVEKGFDRTNSSLVQGFSQLGYNGERNTNAIIQAITNLGCSLNDAANQRYIKELEERNNELRLQRSQTDQTLALQAFVTNYGNNLAATTAANVINALKANTSSYVVTI